MLFNSFPFVFVFLPVSLLGFYGFAKAGSLAARLWLVLASFAFYIWWHPPFAALLLASIVFNYVSSVVIRKLRDQSAQKYFLVFAVGANLFALFYYKYAFALTSWLVGHGAGKTPWASGVLLPLGISFFTFTQIGLLLDSKDGAVTDNSVVNYTLFVTFFPHLIAGPILHHKEMMPQFANAANYRFNSENLARGYSLFIIGMLKKVFLADSLSTVANLGFSSPSSLQFFGAWFAVLCYSLQLYFDFSGYSDMAIGIARMFNIEFPLNFNSPYRASSIIDFWARFHMTLTRYLTLYLYNPLAARAIRKMAARGLPIGRKSLAKPRPFIRVVVIPITFTMVMAGIWHGAGLQFLIFGVLHAFYLVCNHTWRTFGPKKQTNTKSGDLYWLETTFCVALTYIAVVVGEVFFRSSSTPAALTMIAAMSGLHGVNAAVPVPFWLIASLHPLGPWMVAHGWLADAGIVNGSLFLRSVGWLALGYTIVYLLPNSQTITGLSKDPAPPGGMRSGDWIQRLLTLEFSPSWGIAAGILTTLAILEIGAKSEFLYFQF
jgi:D-alanyl-lipoteichoic acid acyltransferase DltB (MBOAT superfamily)